MAVLTDVVKIRDHFALISFVDTKWGHSIGRTFMHKDSGRIEKWQDLRQPALDKPSFYDIGKQSCEVPQSNRHRLMRSKVGESCKLITCAAVARPPSKIPI